MGFLDTIWMFIVTLLSPFTGNAGALTQCDLSSPTVITGNCYIDTIANIMEIQVNDNSTLLLKSNANISSKRVLVTDNSNLTLLEGSYLKAREFLENNSVVEIYGTLEIAGINLSDNVPPEIICDNCHRQNGSTIIFKPEITDPEPSSGLKTMAVCRDSQCRAIFCTNSTSSCRVNLYEIGFPRCSFMTEDYWIYAEDNAGNSNIVKGGEFTVKKENGCPCSYNVECYSGLCKGVPPVCQENPVPEIELV